MKRGVWTQIPGENAMKRWKERATSQAMPKICQRLGEKQEVALSLSPERASPAGALLSALQPPELCKHMLLIFKSPTQPEVLTMVAPQKNTSALGRDKAWIQLWECAEQ